MGDTNAAAAEVHVGHADRDVRDHTTAVVWARCHGRGDIAQLLVTHVDTRATAATADGKGPGQGQARGTDPISTTASTGQHRPARVSTASTVPAADVRRNASIALNYAARIGCSPAVHALLAMGAGACDPAFRHDDHSTALTAAARAGHAGSVGLLAACGRVDVNHERWWGRNALTLAAHMQHGDAVHTLLAVHGIDPNTTAADYTRDEAGDIDAAASAAADDEAGNEPANAIATANANANAAAVAAGAEDGDQTLAPWPGCTPLIAAASQGDDAGIVDALLGMDGIDVNASAVCWQGLNKGTHGFTALIAAAFHGHARVARSLLATRGIDVTHATSFGATPLLAAVSRGHAAGTS